MDGAAQILQKEVYLNQESIAISLNKCIFNYVLLPNTQFQEAMISNTLYIIWQG